MPKIFYLLVLLLAGTAFQSIDLSYLDDMPTVDEVINRINGSGPLNTYTRQIGAFEQLRLMMINGELAPYRRELTKNENELISKYKHAVVNLKHEYEKNVGPLKNKEDISEWMKLCGHYSIDRALRQEIISSLFSANLQRKIEASSTGERMAKQEKIERNRLKAERDVFYNQATIALQKKKLNNGIGFMSAGLLMVVGGIYLSRNLPIKKVLWIDLQVKFFLLIALAGLGVIAIGFESLVDYFD
jgi:hypothetical protein